MLTIPNDAVRCKFMCNSKTEIYQGHDPKTGEPIRAWKIELSAIWEGADSEGSNLCKENHIFSKATPSGRIEMTIADKVAADRFGAGTCFYSDFFEAPKPAYAKAAN